MHRFARTATFALLAILAAAAGADDLSTRIEGIVKPQADAELLSGVLLVARNDEVVFHRAYGFSSWELRVQATASTRFGIASVTKSLTQTLVILLAEQGKLELTAPVESIIPGFPSGPEGGKPTIMNLLTHQSGVPHRVTTEIDETQPISPADIVERVKAQGLLFEPGSKTLYSSAGYTCLARVLEIVTGKTFESLLADKVFAAAGMSSALSETGERLMKNRALPHRLGSHDGNVVVKLAPYKDLRFLTGAGSVYATATDMLHFVQAVERGVFGSRIRGELLRGDDERTWRSLTGRTNGYEASVDILPKEKIVFVFLSNLQSAANWQVRAQIQTLLLGGDPEAIPLPPDVAEPFEAPEPLVGTYGSAEITIRDGKLLRGDNEIYPIEGHRYYIPASGTIMKFRRDEAGNVDALITIRGDGKERVLAKSR